MVDGEAVFSCLTPISVLEQREIRTPRRTRHGASPDRCNLPSSRSRRGNAAIASPHDAAAQALLERHRAPSGSWIRAAFAADLCRCGTHMRIVRAVRPGERGAERRAKP